MAQAPSWIDLARSGNAGVAGTRQPRGVVFVCADSHRRESCRRDGGRSQSVLSDLRGCGALGRRDAVLRQQSRRRRFRAAMDGCPRGGVGANAIAVRLLASQPNGEGDASGRVASPVRACRPARFCDRCRRVLLRSLFRRGGSPARRAGCGARARTRRLSATHFLRQPFQAIQRTRFAFGIRRRRCCAGQEHFCTTGPITVRRCRRQ